VQHISLDSQEDAVKRFILSLPAERDGSVLELNGRAVARVLPVRPADVRGADAEGDWTEAKNARRCALIDREIAGTLAPEEEAELDRLQREMLRHRRRVAPLPLEDARRLHQELLAEAQRRQDGG
jgi:hypothetical protein